MSATTSFNSLIARRQISHVIAKHDSARATIDWRTGHGRCLLAVTSGKQSRSIVEPRGKAPCRPIEFSSTRWSGTLLSRVFASKFAAMGRDRSGRGRVSAAVTVEVVEVDGNVALSATFEWFINRIKPDVKPGELKPTTPNQ
jgi:hypothetical protein